MSSVLCLPFQVESPQDRKFFWLSRYSCYKYWHHQIQKAKAHALTSSSLIWISFPGYSCRRYSLMDDDAVSWPVATGSANPWLLKLARILLENRAETCTYRMVLT